MQEEVIIEVYDIDENPFIWASQPIDSEDVIKGATGLNRYMNDPKYRPKTVIYKRKGHVVFGTVYSKDDKNVLKQKMKHQHAVEESKELHGKKVKLNFKDESGKHHETKDAEVSDHDDKHIHVKLTKDIKGDDGKVAHKKGKTIKVPKIVTREWLHNAGDTRVSHHEEKEEK